MTSSWQPGSWRDRECLQQPEYADQAGLADVVKALGEYPPLVTTAEIIKLKQQIGKAGRGEMFILHGGDCAERFIDCNENAITNQLKILLQMSVILMYGLRKPAIRIGRIAGQYAKPRSSLFETINGTTIPTYRGDSINGYRADSASRKPNPERLRRSYFHAALTLNYIRSKINSGFADLHNPYNWNLHAIEQTSRWPKYKAIVDHILDAINFMDAFGGLRSESLGRIDFFNSHEGLLLNYEEALTRLDPVSGAYYNRGAHLLWLGDRTRNLDHGHIEYFRGIANPIGVKLGPGCSGDEAVALCKVLNPDNEEGRLLFITRMGADRVESRLPEILKSVRKAKCTVTWCCDPMHGNSIVLEDGQKTRDFSAVLQELKQSTRIHDEAGSLLAGAHFELTGENVTECIGGAVDVKNSDLSENYATYCDPRLNYAQSLEMAFLISRLFQRN